MKFSDVTVIGTLLMVQFVAIPFAFLFGWLAKKLGTKRAIYLSLVIYTLIAILGYFLSQDSWLGPNRQVAYSTLDKNWQNFNRVYILIYPADKATTVQAILGSDWDVATNRQNALDTAKAETEKDPKNAFAWFNLGTNQTYFEQYGSAAKSYDTARALGLPIRMLRYQFGPFIAYFHVNRTDDLMALVDYALQITFNSEEAFLWKGWALYRLGRKADALDAFNQAIKVHPGYGDALYALNFVQNN